jgi:hypothetical protein
VGLLLVVPHLQMFYVSGLSYNRKQEEVAWRRVRGIYVTDEPAEFVVRSKSTVKFGQSEGVRCDLPRNGPAFLGL